jgi:hypothetical protein
VALCQKTCLLKLNIKKRFSNSARGWDKRYLLPKRFVTTKRMEVFGMYHSLIILPLDIGGHQNIMVAFHGSKRCSAQD